MNYHYPFILKVSGVVHDTQFNGDYRYVGEDSPLSLLFEHIDDPDYMIVREHNAMIDQYRFTLRKGNSTHYDTAWDPDPELSLEEVTWSPRPIAEGTPQVTYYDPIPITTEAELRTIIETEFTRSADYALKNNIVLSDDAFSGLGNVAYPFNGHFDGEFRRISNIHASLSGLGDIGASGLVERLHLSVSSLNASNGRYAFTNLNWGHIRYCWVEGDFFQMFYHSSGFCGTNYGRIENCYSRVAITNNWTLSFVSITGFVDTNQTNGVIENCYYAGHLISDAVPRVGFCRVNNGSMTGCHYDKERANTETSAGGTAQTTETMRNPETYQGWDFEETWFIQSTFNEGYPYLDPSVRIGRFRAFGLFAGLYRSGVIGMSGTIRKR